MLEHLAVKPRLGTPPGKLPHGQAALPVPVHGEPGGSPYTIVMPHSPGDE